MSGMTSEIEDTDFMTSEIEDTDYDTFTLNPPNSPNPKLSPISHGSDERIRSDEMLNLGIDHNSLLGVIVDRSSFDEDDELTTFGRASLNLPQHQQLDLDLPLGGVVMKNGRVRRRMRWKPRFGKKKSSNYSSNASVISALTNRSSSTTRSFLSHFSRKSNTSFHTFHSTETPVATNKANRPQAPHTVMRPNYQDSFDTKDPPTQTKYSTIANEGKYMHLQRKGGSSQFSVSSSSGFPSTKLDSVKESSHSEDVEVNRTSSLSSSVNNSSNGSVHGLKANAIESINVKTSSNDSVGPHSVISAMSKGSITKASIPSVIKSSKGTSQQQSKTRRPPLFKRRQRHKRNKSWGNISINSNGNKNSSQNLPSPTETNSTASLSSTISLERENSGLPVLTGDDQDRRVEIEITGSKSVTESIEASKAKSLFVEDGPEENSVSPTVQSSISDNNSGGHSSRSASSLSRNTTSSSLQKRVSSITKKRSTSSTSISTASPQRSSGSGSIVTPPSPSEKPVAQSITPLTGKFVSSAPCDLDEAAFLEAENNLRAIHEMATEHLKHGEYVEAIEVFEEILRGQQERYGQDHYRVGTALHNLGIVYLKKGDYKKAIDICKRAVYVRKDSLVPNHPDVAVSLAQLGVAHLESRNYREAIVVFRDALNIRRNFLGPRHMKCAKILNNIGCALYSIDNLVEAKRAFDEALEIQREGLRSLPTIENNGDSNGVQTNTLLLSMASTLCNIGSIRLRWGHFEKAEIALEEALLVRLVVF